MSPAILMPPAILMRALALACVACFALALGLTVANAQDTTVKVGSLFGSFEPYIRELVGIAVAAVAAFVLKLIYSWTGVTVDARHREAIETFLVNQAGALIAKVGDPLKAMTFDARSQTIAALANEALARIPDAVAYFGLSPDNLAERIKAKVGLIAGAQASVPVTAPPTA